MQNPYVYHEKIKEKEHIFLYCVAGRSSSTAFQRILNSSNEVWLWGEQHQLIDEIIFVISEMKRLGDSSYVKRALQYVDQSVKRNKHVFLYANAIGNLDETSALLNSSISNLLKPKNTKTERFGFKDITVSRIETLTYLKEIYGNSFFMFCFRDPLKQWPSIDKLKWFKYNEIDEFLIEYTRVSNIYIEFATKWKVNSFVENDDLRNLEKVKHIMKHVKIKTIDSDLIDVTIGGADSQELPNEHRSLILNSEAYQNYNEMKKISDRFFEI